MPWIWGAADSAKLSPDDMVEMCEVDYTQKARSEAEVEPQMKDYAVSLPLQWAHELIAILPSLGIATEKRAGARGVSRRAAFRGFASVLSRQGRGRRRAQ